MSTSTDQVVVVIIAVIAVLLFLGILFLVTIVYSSNKRKQQQKETKAILDEFNKQLMQSKLEMQEDTFNFISQEIHDNVGQVLSFAKVQLAILEEGNTFDKELIQQTKESVSRVMSELRDIAKSLSTERIQAFDFSTTITEEVARINKTKLVQIILHKQGNIAIKDEHKLILFRVIQEGLQNMVKHAKASTIYVDLIGSQHEFQVLLKDNGVGFHVENALKANHGLGLKNMQQRMRLIGGAISITSEEGQGSSIQININND